MTVIFHILDVIARSIGAVAALVLLAFLGAWAVQYLRLWLGGKHG